ncbi:hypothetical protein FNH22_08665 [Fulvivirga sp. M361]|uniref:hypothetical protein n=1 Tax=Fulvivirga sp. M361 TaxID=2594266 RepID=UPI001179C984|nr:hypothetical protein [Fulvivirga sp. M361]TRX60111.1 hypothetical protein FNH22_08665 [Fulvivirga sp. M361]
MSFFKRIANYTLSEQQLKWVLIFVAVLFSLIPVFVKFPFKINLFLAWEGAYRLANGQIPYRDFYLPMGIGFWIIPALFFKLFGAKLFTLIFAQCLINFISCLAFIGIFRILQVSRIKILLGLLVFCLSYVFVNFWPWYNQTVFVFGLIAIYFLLKHFYGNTVTNKITYLALTCFFLVLAFFTKQDGGALTIAIATVIIIADSLLIRNYKWVALYFLLMAIFSIGFILPFLGFDFTYWFNLGQPPHFSRISLGDILKDIFEHSNWLKFYLLVFVVIVFNKINKESDFLKNRKSIHFILLSFGILVQAAIVQVTSYIPHNVNIYFHSFALVFILSNLKLEFNLTQLKYISVLVIFILFWWSNDYWRYGKRVVNRVFPQSVVQGNDPSKISKYTWSLNKAQGALKRQKWKLSKIPSFKNIYLPEATIEGILNIKKLVDENFDNTDDLKVLNMSELTPLARELGYTPLVNHPLWFHKNVSIFDEQIKNICENINKEYYDLVLFQDIPNLNNFFPYELQSCLQSSSYCINDKFLAPRVKENSYIEVYVKKDCY